MCRSRALLLRNVSRNTAQQTRKAVQSSQLLDEDTDTDAAQPGKLPGDRGEGGPAETRDCANPSGASHWQLDCISPGRCPVTPPSPACLSEALMLALTFFFSGNPVPSPAARCFLSPAWFCPLRRAHRVSSVHTLAAR